MTDRRTLDFYANHASALAVQYERAGSAVARHLRLAFEPGARVLDVGSGSGRDISVLAREGVTAYGVEPVAAMRRVASECHPEISERVLAGTLPGLPDIKDLGGRFDGVLCSAVLHHLDRGKLFEAAFEIRAVLKAGGRLLVSLPSPPDGTIGPARDSDGRLHNGVSADELDLLLSRIGFLQIQRWEDADTLGRKDRTWTTLLFRLDVAGDAVGVARPLDLVQAVLARDRKVATYKPALLRALTDIALTQPHLIRWSRGDVLVPITSVAERWVVYYWKLLEVRPILPQLQGDWKRDRHTLGFAEQLTRLVHSYPRSIGLSVFAVDQRGGEFTVERKTLYLDVMQAVVRALRRGPIRHTGGSLGTGLLFRSSGADIVVAGPLWKELCLSGYWIRDALLHRWAELVVRLSERSVDVSRVVAALLVAPESDREQSAARDFLKSMTDLRCVWSDVPLAKSGFDIDHLIPFSLWRNNDLWNLLPASRTVNQKKLDRLPSAGLLRRRRESVLRCWRRAQEARSERFEREASALLGRERWCSEELFEVMVECVEVTATQTGALRFDC